LKRIVVITIKKLLLFNTSSDVAAFELAELAKNDGVVIVEDDWLFSENKCADAVVLWEFESLRTEKAYNILIKMADKIPVIFQLGDWQFVFDKNTKSKYSSKILELAKKCASVPCRYISYAKEHLPELADKMWFLPHSFGSIDRCLKSDKEERINRVMVGGQVGHNFYPERIEAKKIARANSEFMVSIWHPTDREYGISGKKCFGGEYSLVLGSYIASVATPSKYGFLLRKYFEIPAVNTLLLAFYCKDLEEQTELRPNQHFLPISNDNLIQTAIDVCSRPKDYYEMRCSARDLVRQNYSSEKTMKLMMEKIMEVA